MGSRDLGCLWQKQVYGIVPRRDMMMMVYLISTRLPLGRRSDGPSFTICSAIGRGAGAMPVPDGISNVGTNNGIFFDVALPESATATIPYMGD